ncbi:SusC/RagA family TonB-linked outer membrane protein [Chitinophaga rhizosphaerae]|uniref:SusC/RagA family TonB-linked outer membrane protein n=1 Tax=Chitinophaga rhizosphaerae TaxID=1864947 RepID=UPI00196AEFBB|nr:SusC/RagA family TonB-linked outer membrane protein [Chitinophaga rhizosphaerae]
MRISILAILLTFNGILVAADGAGQDIRKVIVSVDLNNVTLRQALREIGSLADCSFTYKTRDLEGYGNVTYRAADIPVGKLLDALLLPKGLRYEQMDDHIVIKKIPPNNVFEAAPAEAPEFDGGIRGIVRTSDGRPLPFATVQIAGTSQGTVADEEGRYSIGGLKAGTYKLNASAIGHKAQTVTVTVTDGFTVADFTMDANDSQLSEVVVTALGIKRDERSLGYARQGVKGENLTFTKEQNVLGSLAGKVAGVQVTGASGASMGGTQKIKIRGVNSLSGADQPLIVIDGTPISNANYAGMDGADYGNLAQDINPEDVESVEVLKGPAASALYGIRGQYGVIMITTRKGSKGPKKVNVTLNSAFSLEKAGNFMPMQNLYGGGSSQTWSTNAAGEKVVGMSVDESWGPKADGTPARQVFSYYPQDPTYGQTTPFVAYPDNIKDFYETGYTFNNGVNVTGGNQNTAFRLSYNNTSIGGIEPNTWLKRNNLGFSGSLDLLPNLTVTTNLNYANNKAQRPKQGSEDGARFMVQWFQRSMDMRRLRDYKYPDGRILGWSISTPTAANPLPRLTNWNNPYFLAYESPTNDYRDRFFGDVGLTYEVIPGLKLSGFARGDMFTQNIQSRHGFGGLGTPEYTVGKYQNTEMNYEFLAQYTKNWGELSLNTNIGANSYQRKYSYMSGATVGGLTSPDFFNLEASKDRPTIENYYSEKKIRSMYGLVSLGYKNRYFLEATVRNDNSSTLIQDHNSYWYPSVSASYVFSDDLKWKPLSYGKLRVSYAQAGSDLSVYQTSQNFGVGTIYTLPDGTAVNTMYVRDNLVNPNIKPSFAHSYEAGVDLKFLNNRIGLDFTWYMQKNVDQIIPLALSSTSGYSGTIINAGMIRNKGIELTLSATPVTTGFFTWQTIFNLNRNRSMVVELGPNQNVYPLDFTRYSQVDSYLNSYVGEPFGSLIGKAYQRDPATGMILLGDNNMPLYTSATHNFGSVLPDMTGGWQNMFKIWKFDVGAMIDWQKGGQFFSRTWMLAHKTGIAPATAEINDKGKNVRDPVADGGGVKVTGISNTTKQYVEAYVDAKAYWRTNVATHVYEEWLVDATYVKLRELRLGYTFDKKSLGRLPLQSINLAFIARNPAMIYQKAPKGLDPSELSSGATSISWRESGQANTVRSYGVNLIVNF